MNMTAAAPARRLLNKVLGNGGLGLATVGTNALFLMVILALVVT